MKILLIGSGGREHALAWKLASSPKVSQVYVAPGNVGTQMEPKVTNLNITDIQELAIFAKSNQIEFTVVGPEAPLAAGIVDLFQSHGLKIWGPTQFCAKLESSKAFAKEFMVQFGIPTAKYAKFSDIDSAQKYIENQGAPIVIKADGLAAGKGVLVATTVEEAIEFTRDVLLDNKFGSAGSSVVIEEFLSGVEASFIAMIDGKSVLAMATSQDHKRLLDGDAGPNTGGMGAYSPAPVVTPEIHKFVMDKVMYRVIEGMKELGHSYTGFLYAGLMISPSGEVKVLEFNCRFGDPETQPIMLRLESDLSQLIKSGLNQELDLVNAVWTSSASVGVVLAAANYPDSPRINDEIVIDHDLYNNHNLKLFHAGTKLSQGKLLSSGGRVLCLVALAATHEEAVRDVYANITKINFAGMQYRHDIAKFVLAK